MPELEDTSSRKQPPGFKRQEKKEETKENVETKEGNDEKGNEYANNKPFQAPFSNIVGKDVNKGLTRADSFADLDRNNEKNICDTPNIGACKANEDDMPESGNKSIALLINSDKNLISREAGTFKCIQEKNKESMTSFRDPSQQDNHNYSLNSPTNFSNAKAQSSKHLTGLGGSVSPNHNIQSNAAAFNMLTSNEGMKSFVDHFMKAMSSQQNDLGNSGKGLGLSSLKIKNDETDKLRAIEELKEKLEISDKEKSNIIKKYQEKEKLLLERVNKLESLLQASDKWDIVTLERQNKDYETKIINLSRQISSLQMQLNEEKKKQNSSAGEMMILKQKMIDEICKYKEFNISVDKRKDRLNTQINRSADLNHSDNIRYEGEPEQGFDRENNTFYMQSNRKLTEKVGDISQETSGTVNFNSGKALGNNNEIKETSNQNTSPQKLSNYDRDNHSFNNDIKVELTPKKKAKKISNPTFLAARKLLQPKRDKSEND